MNYLVKLPNTQRFNKLVQHTCNTSWNTSWIIPSASSTSRNLCLTVSLPWSCHDHRFHQRHLCHRLSPVLFVTPDSQHTFSTTYFHHSLPIKDHPCTDFTVTRPAQCFSQLSVVDWAWRCRILSELYIYCNLIDWLKLSHDIHMRVAELHSQRE